MNTLTLSVKTVRHKGLSYAATLLSSAFAVWLYFVYSLVANHPDLQGNWEVQFSISALQWLIVGFALLFIFHAHAAFMKTRKKEFGILLQVGMLHRQIAQLIYWENTIVALTAMASGILVGTITVKLVLLGVGRALGFSQPLLFHFSLSALFQTLVVFTFIFGAISIYDHVSLARTSIGDLIRSAARPQRPPQVSRLLSTLAFVSTGTAYFITLRLTEKNAESLVVPIALLLLLGTYLLFAQGSAAVIRLLQRNPKAHYRRTNLIILAQLLYKMRGNARVLFLVAILSTLVLTGVGLYYGSFDVLEDVSEGYAPLGLMLVADDQALRIRLNQLPVDDTLSAQGASVSGRAYLQGIEVEATLGQKSIAGIPPEALANIYSRGVTMVGAESFNAWLQNLTTLPPIQLEAGHAVIVTSTNLIKKEAPPTVKVRVADGDAPIELAVNSSLRADVFNQTSRLLTVLVVPEATFLTFWEQSGQTRGLEILGFNFADWKESSAGVRSVEESVGPCDSDSCIDVTATALFFERQRQSASLQFMLIGSLSLLFFLAAGNMVYFKLFSDLYEDRQQFRVLDKLGLGLASMRHIVSVQTFVLFFAPFAIALVHATVAIKALGSVLAGESLLAQMYGAAGAYAVLYVLYYFVTRHTYLRVLLHQGQEG